MARTLGDLAVTELIKSAQNELLGLKTRLGSDQDTVIKAYLSSIGARLAVAEDKMAEFLAQDRQV